MKIKDLYNQIRDGNIKSDISLQREIVYSEENQVLVIDSLVKGIPLPAFYLWKNNKGILEVFVAACCCPMTTSSSPSSCCFPIVVGAPGGRRTLNRNCIIRAC